MYEAEYKNKNYLVEIVMRGPKGDPGDAGKDYQGQIDAINVKLVAIDTEIINIDSRITVLENKKVKLSDIEDVEIIDDVTDGQVLIYDVNTNLWKPGYTTAQIGITSFSYRYETDDTSTPASGRVNTDNTLDPNLVTKLYINKNDRTGVDISLFLDEIKEGDWLNLYDRNDQSINESYDVAGEIIRVGDVYEIPVVLYGFSQERLNDGQRIELFWKKIESRTDLSMLPAGSVILNSRNFSGENGELWQNLETDAYIDPIYAPKLLALYGTEKILDFGYNAVLNDNRLESTLYYISMKNGYSIVKQQDTSSQLIRLANKDFTEVVENSANVQTFRNILTPYKNGYLIFDGTTSLRYTSYDTTLPTTLEVFNSRNDEYNNPTWLRDLIPDGAIRSGTFFKNDNYYGFFVDGGTNDRNIFYCDSATFESTLDASNFTLLDVKSLVPIENVFNYTMNAITYNNKIIRGYYGERDLHQIDIISNELKTISLNSPINANRTMISYDKENTYFISSDLTGCNIYNLETFELIKRLDGKTAVFYGIFNNKEVIFYSEIVNTNIFYANITHYSIDNDVYEFADILPSGISPRVFYDSSGNDVFKFNIVAQNQKHALDNDELIFAASTEGIIKFDMSIIDTGMIRIKSVPGDGQKYNFIKVE